MSNNFLLDDLKKKTRPAPTAVRIQVNSPAINACMIGSKFTNQLLIQSFRVSIRRLLQIFSERFMVFLWMMTSADWSNSKMEIS